MQLKRALRPCIENLRLSLTNATEVDRLVWPHTRLFPGINSATYLLFQPDAGVALTDVVIELHGTLGGDPYCLEVPIRASDLVVAAAGGGEDTPSLVHALAARALIRHHDAVVPATEASRGRVLDLALEYGLASSQTAFVAVLEREAQDAADPADNGSMDFVPVTTMAANEAQFGQRTVAGTAGKRPSNPCTTRRRAEPPINRIASSIPRQQDSKTCFSSTLPRSPFAWLTWWG